MALSDDRIAEMMRDTWGCASIAPRHAAAFARAIEAEVRKDDDALILQLVEALESSNVEWKQLADSSDAGLWRAEDQDYYQQSEKAITAGRAWLEGKK